MVPNRLGLPANSWLMFHMKVGIGGLLAAMSGAPREQRGRDERREGVVLRQARLHGLLVVDELVVVLGADHELATVDPALGVDHVEVRLDAVRDISV